jgi:hypothetical protein
MKNKLSNIAVVLLGLLLMVGMVAGFLYCTRPEAWYAGQHTEGCDGSRECGCYELLLDLDYARGR